VCCTKPEISENFSYKISEKNREFKKMNKITKSWLEKYLLPNEANCLQSFHVREMTESKGYCSNIFVVQIENGQR